MEIGLVHHDRRSSVEGLSGQELPISLLKADILAESLTPEATPHRTAMAETFHPTHLKLHHGTASNDELIALCADPAHEVIGGEPYGNQVVRISDEAVVKFGIGVKEEEAKNQSAAYELLDRNFVRVPRVYRFFIYKTCGYIVMEHINGSVFDRLEDPDSIAITARILDYFSTIRNDRPGPLGGGVSRGLLWPDNEDLSFDTVEHMEDFLNSRISREPGRLALRGYDLVLCHLDIAPRNILVLEDGSVCLIDWASAGFYPRFFEFCIQWINMDKDGKFIESWRTP